MTRVIAQLILPVLALVFGVAALLRWAHDGFKLGPASRTWLTVAAIFSAVSVWLWWSGARQTQAYLLST